MNKDIPATNRFVRENFLSFRTLNWKIFVVHYELQAIPGRKYHKKCSTQLGKNVNWDPGGGKCPAPGRKV